MLSLRKKNPSGFEQKLISVQHASSPLESSYVRTGGGGSLPVELLQHLKQFMFQHPMTEVCF
jgi:hypothetical protein